MLTTLLLSLLTAVSARYLVFATVRLNDGLTAFERELDAQAAILPALARRIEDRERLAYGLPVAAEEEVHGRCYLHRLASAAGAD